MSQFHRIAERGVLLINTFLRRVVRHNNIKAQFGEKIGVKGIIGIDQKAAVKPDASPAFD